MRFRGAFVKCVNIQQALAFWKAVLQVEPAQVSEDTHEFTIEGGIFGIYHNTGQDKYLAASAAPVFHMSYEEAKQVMARVTAAGGQIFYDGLDAPADQYAYCLDPENNEFELNAKM